MGCAQGGFITRRRGGLLKKAGGPDGKGMIGEKANEGESRGACCRTTERPHPACEFAGWMPQGLGETVSDKE